MGALMDVPAGLRERKKRETRDRIVTVAFELFQAQGYDQTTLAQIAERAQVSARTVSNYFPQKVDLLVAYRESMLQVIERSLRLSREADPLRRIRAALLTVARENQRHPNGRLAQRLLARYGSYRALDGIQERFRADVLEVLRDARLRPNVDLELAVLTLSASHLAVIQRWAAREHGSLVGPVERLFDQWLQGIAPT
jgi:AcrR family transcriptional regulator